MKIQLTNRGKGFTLSSATVLVLGALFKDALLACLAALLISLALYSLARLLLNARLLAKHSSSVPSSASVRLTAGDEGAFTTTIECKRKRELKFSVEHPLKFCAPERGEYATNEPIKFSVKPLRSGAFESDHLKVTVYAPYRLFVAHLNYPFKTDITVIPRIIPALIRALEVLLMVGRFGFDAPVQLLGRGTEYAETREYMPGDDLKRIDWKATARLQKLMVKQFYREEGGSMCLIYDLKVAGEITRDAVASEFLNLAAALAAQGINYSVAFVDESNRISVKKHENEREALLTAIKCAISTVTVDYSYLYDVLGPHKGRELVQLLSLLNKDAIRSLSEGSYKDLDVVDTIVISCLLGDIGWILNLNDRLKAGGRRLTVHTTNKVWLDSKSLEDAYMDYNRFMKVASCLKKEGIEVKFI